MQNFSTTVEEIAPGIWIMRIHPILNAVYGAAFCATVILIRQSPDTVMLKASIWLPGYLNTNAWRVVEQALEDMGFTKRNYERYTNNTHRELKV